MYFVIYIVISLRNYFFSSYVISSDRYLVRFCVLYLSSVFLFSVCCISLFMYVFRYLFM